MNSLKNPESKANLGRTRWVAGLGLLALLTFAGQGADASFSSPYSRLELPGHRIGLHFFVGDNGDKAGDSLHATLVCVEDGRPISGHEAGWFSFGNKGERTRLIRDVAPQFTDYDTVNFVSRGDPDGDGPAPLVGVYGENFEGMKVLWKKDKQMNVVEFIEAKQVPFNRKYYRGVGRYDVTGGCEDVVEAQNESAK